MATGFKRLSIGHSLDPSVQQTVKYLLNHHCGLAVIGDWLIVGQVMPAQVVITVLLQTCLLYLGLQIEHCSRCALSNSRLHRSDPALSSPGFYGHRTASYFSWIYWATALLAMVQGLSQILHNLSVQSESDHMGQQHWSHSPPLTSPSFQRTVTRCIYVYIRFISNSPGHTASPNFFERASRTMRGGCLIFGLIR
jgi:hypothetical protein